MEITCKRCQTEYDFDDALVSERGTTVRCTNCGEQFKVFRAHVSAIPERWVVQRRDGRELVFTNLRDLQRAITNLQVGRHDTLTRGGGPPRPLGAIAELEPFFLGRIGQGPTPQPGPTGSKTEAGLAPAQGSLDDLPNRTGRTGRPPADGPPVPPQALLIAPNPVPKIADEADVHARTMMDPRQGGGNSITAAYAPVVQNPPPPPPPVPQPQTRIGPNYEPAVNEARISYSPEQDWFGEPRFSNSPPTRSRALRWLVALFVLGMLGVAGATVGRKYVSMVIRPTAPAAQGSEGRVETLLDDGERALSDGDLETAKESFDKASALAERDSRVLVDLARLDAARADLDWLKVRLLPGDQGDVLAAAKRQAQDSAARAMKLADKAAEVAPDDAKVVRAKIDALRLTGDLAGARLLVARVGSIAGQPETAYVLAALDLAEDAPSFPPVIDRLKTAAAGEQNLLRARGALVYALVRSGDVALAKSELDKIAGATHPYPLLAELKAYVARSSGESAIGKRDAGAAATVDARAPDTKLADIRAPGGGGGEPVPAGDFRSLLQQAAQASASRQYDRAEQLYSAALASNPGDTEALAGLGDVARARGNAAGARSYYEQVLARNPHYLPALAALADIKWDSGDHAGAVKLYRELVETSSEGAAAQRAKDRIAQFEAAGGTAQAKPAAKPQPVERPADTAPAAPSPPSDLPPGVDTSDLPGFKR
jgi:predicted Zn finger-like uncharacterized protein